jgi:hypothetical protein
MVNLKTNDLNVKNNFVISLREHLQSMYGTNRNYTYGEGDFEGKKIGGGYNLVRRDPNVPRDINGFCFRKDMCLNPPWNETEVLKNIHLFASGKKNIESILQSDGRAQLSIKRGKDTYSVTAHIEEGYAGEISIYFMKLPYF